MGRDPRTPLIPARIAVDASLGEKLVGRRGKARPDLIGSSPRWQRPAEERGRGRPATACVESPT